MSRSPFKNIPVGKLVEALLSFAAPDDLVCVNVLVDASAPSEAIDAAMRAFSPETDEVVLAIDAFFDEAPALDPACDLLIVIAGESPAVARVAAQAVATGVPVAVCAADPKGVFDRASKTAFPLEPGDVVDMDAKSEYEDFEHDLATWIVDKAPRSRSAMARTFAFMRRPLAVDAVQQAAVACGAVGAVPLIPGADMPLMIAIQARMILQISAAYGQTLTSATAVELASTIPAGYVSRGIARSIGKAVGGPLAWVSNGAVAAGATTALGMGAIKYYENGGMPDAAREKLDQALAKVGELGDGKVGQVASQVLATAASLPSTAIAAASEGTRAPLAPAADEDVPAGAVADDGMTDEEWLGAVGGDAEPVA